MQVHQETFGKSGARRIVPGEYLAVDPKGRACMIGAVEKQKLVRLSNGLLGLPSFCMLIIYMVSSCTHTCSQYCRSLLTTYLCFIAQVYVLNRDSAANLTISSPLEAHKSHNIVFDITGLDCGFDNPIFAAIELDYSEADLVIPILRHRSSHAVWYAISDDRGYFMIGKSTWTPSDSIIH